MTEPGLQACLQKAPNPFGSVLFICLFQNRPVENLFPLFNHGSLVAKVSGGEAVGNLADFLPAGQGPMPIGVCAADLAESNDPRERRAGARNPYRTHHGIQQGNEQ